METTNKILENETFTTLSTESKKLLKAYIQRYLKGNISKNFDMEKGKILIPNIGADRIDFVRSTSNPTSQKLEVQDKFFDACRVVMEKGDYLVYQKRNITDFEIRLMYAFFGVVIDYCGLIIIIHTLSNAEIKKGKNAFFKYMPEQEK